MSWKERLVAALLLAIAVGGGALIPRLLASPATPLGIALGAGPRPKRRPGAGYPQAAPPCGSPERRLQRRPELLRLRSRPFDPGHRAADPGHERRAARSTPRPRHLRLLPRRRHRAGSLQPPPSPAAAAPRRPAAVSPAQGLPTEPRHGPPRRAVPRATPGTRARFQAAPPARRETSARAAPRARACCQAAAPAESQASARTASRARASLQAAALAATSTAPRRRIRRARSARIRAWPAFRKLRPTPVGPRPRARGTSGAACPRSSAGR